MNGNDITEKVQDWEKPAEEMQEQARAWKDRAMESARHAGEVTDRYVRENIWTTVAVVAVAACALGFLLAHRD